MLYGLSTSVGDPTATAEVVRVVEIFQQFHDLLWIDVTKIVKWKDWGHDLFSYLLTKKGKDYIVHFKRIKSIYLFIYRY